MNGFNLLAAAIASLGIVACIDVGASQAKELSQLQLCHKFLGLGITAQLVESTCGIKGPVSKRVLSIYEQGDCRHVVPQDQVDSVITSISDSIKKQIHQPSVGLANFCEAGKGWYHDKLDKRHWFDHDPDRR